MNKSLYVITLNANQEIIKIGKWKGEAKKLLRRFNTSWHPQGYKLLRFWTGEEYYSIESELLNHENMKSHRIEKTKWYKISVDIVDLCVSELIIKNNNIKMKLTNNTNKLLFSPIILKSKENEELDDTEIIGESEEEPEINIMRSKNNLPKYVKSSNDNICLDKYLEYLERRFSKFYFENDKLVIETGKDKTEIKPTTYDEQLELDFFIDIFIKNKYPIPSEYIYKNKYDEYYVSLTEIFKLYSKFHIVDTDYDEFTIVSYSDIKVYDTIIISDYEDNIKICDVEGNIRQLTEFLSV